MADLKKCFIGIDTSNYTTSFAICDTDGNIVANIKKLLDVKNGEVGLRQSDAVFSHIKNFPQIADKIRETMRGYTPIAIGYSARPRDIENSYMPTFLTGEAVASVVSAVFDIPSFDFSHQAGHIMAAAYSSGYLKELLKNDFLAFHLSGGTTDLLYVSPNENGFYIKQIGGSKDINAGQAIDRTGVMMGLKFPCGAEIEKLALLNKEKIKGVKISLDKTFCNLSGVQNITEKLFKETNNKEYVSAFVLEFIEKMVEAMSVNARKQYGELPILFAGGVMSNSIIKSKISKLDNVYFAEPQFSSDNASGIALLTRKKYIK